MLVYKILINDDFLGTESINIKEHSDIGIVLKVRNDANILNVKDPNNNIVSISKDKFKGYTFFQLKTENPESKVYTTDILFEQKVIQVKLYLNIYECDIWEIDEGTTDLPKNIHTEELGRVNLGKKVLVIK